MTPKNDPHFIQILTPNFLAYAVYKNEENPNQVVFDFQKIVLIGLDKEGWIYNLVSDDFTYSEPSDVSNFIGFHRGHPTSYNGIIGHVEEN